MKRLLLAALLFASLCLPAFAQGQYKVLVVAIPNKYHHDFTVVAKPRFERMAQAHGFDMTWAWNASPFDGDLSQYAAIVLLSTSGEDLAKPQRGKLEAYVRDGGGIVAVHRALIINPPGDWPWYEKMIGRSFITHPMVQTATVRTIDPSFPATFGLPARWIWTDEWYEFKPPLVDGLHDVLEVDESSYDPTRIWPGQVAKGMGKHHPVAWYHAYDGGRVFATARALIINPPGDWPWYEKMIGRTFITHPMVQTATVRTIDPTFPATFGLPARWIWTDEWYEFNPPLIDGLHDVLAVDESTYDPTRIWPGQVAKGMGAHHPVAWYHAYDGGRVFATALGHTPALWDDRLFLEHLYGGIWWAATGKGIDTAKR